MGMGNVKMNTPDSAQNPPTSFPGQMYREMNDVVQIFILGIDSDPFVYMFKFDFIGISQWSYRFVSTTTSFRPIPTLLYDLNLVLNPQ